MIVDLDNTMVKDFSQFKYNYFIFLFFCSTMCINCCSSVSVMTTVSSAYLKLLITLLPVLKQPFPSMLLMIISVQSK